MTAQDRPDSRLDVVVFPRRKATHLAVVLGEQHAGTKRAMLELLAEDGPAFKLPARVALARVPDGVAGRRDEDHGRLTERLRALRADLPAAPDWEALHGLAEPGEPIAVEELARRAGLAGGGGVLAVALGLHEAAPWFRRSDGRLVAADRERALATLRAHEAERLAAAEDEALERAWRAGDALDGIDPDSGAVRDLIAFALTAAPSEHPRGEQLARRLECAEPDQALARLVERGILPADVNPAPHRAGVAAPPTPEVVAEVAALASADPAGSDAAARVDLTDVPTIAIDSAKTRDVDDAFSARSVDGGIELLIHIADVAAVVAPGSALDRHAWERAGTLYAPDGTVPMLPDDLVAGRLALLAGQVRPSVTARVVVRPDGSTGPCAFERTLVRVDRNVTYDESRDLASLFPAADLGPAVLDAARALLAARKAAGARVLDLPSLDVALVDERPEVSVRVADSPGDLIVGEAMVLYNREAAAQLTAADWAAVYRAQAEGREPLPELDDPLLPVRARRAFARVEVGPDPGPHHGLGVAAYLQATSPIRRYGDLVNQRQLAALAASGAPPYPRAAVQAVADHVSGQERRLRRAGDERVRHWVARWLADQVASGKRTTLDGVLSRAPRRGLGAVYVPELCRELPLRAPRDWQPPEEGTAGRWRIGRIARYGGRIELVPPPAAPDAPDGAAPAGGAS